jgi:hypothetical protein
LVGKVKFRGNKYVSGKKRFNEIQESEPQGGLSNVNVDIHNQTFNSTKKKYSSLIRHHAMMTYGGMEV